MGVEIPMLVLDLFHWLIPLFCQLQDILSSMICPLQTSLCMVTDMPTPYSVVVDEQNKHNYQYLAFLLSLTRPYRTY